MTIKIVPGMKEHVKDKEIEAKPTKTDEVVVAKIKDLKEILSNYHEAEKYLTQIRPDITLPTAKEITIAFINDNFYDIIMTPRPIQEQEQQKYIEKKKYVSYLLDQAKVNENGTSIKLDNNVSLTKQETKTPKISKKEYIQYTKNLRDILGVTIPAQTEVTRDFVKNSALAKALQYTPEQFIADERENANIAKISAIFILEQAEQNENTKELSGIEDTTIIKHTPLIIEKRTIEETTIETTPHLIKRKVTEMKIEEESKTHKEVEKIDHEDLAILERSIKNLTFSISKDNEEKFNAALTGIDQLIKKYTSKRSYKAFRKQYNNTTTHALSLQKIIVDIKKEPGRKTLLQELLDEVRKKNK